MSRKYIKFTGEFAQLKKMGYEFQKLFASNYMQWHKDETRVWKKGGDVTIERVLNHTGEFFELYMANRDNLPWKETFRTEYLRVIVDRETNELSLDVGAYYRETQKAHAEDRLCTLECVAFTRRLLVPLEEFIELGWVELGEWE